MKKKMLAVLLAVSMVASMTACGSSKSESTDGAKEASDLKIGLITDVGGVNDGSFNQSSWEGLERAGEELGVTVNYLESATDADYKPNIETFIDEDYDLIISVGYMLADATREAAEANPDTKFAIIDDSSIDLPNVTSLIFHAEQASYLVGYVAGLTTKSNNIGFVVGMTNETMNQFGYGYCAGAIDANPDVTVQQMNANSFADSATGKSMANAEITNGADIVFQAAGATGLGVIEACQEAGIYAIGDCVFGHAQLAHTASAMGEVASENICGLEAHYCEKTNPTCVYMEPEAASVGLTEEQCKAQGIAYKVGKFPMSANGKALILNGGEGIRIIPAPYPAMQMVMPVGGFLVLGCVIAASQWLVKHLEMKNKKKEAAK